MHGCACCTHNALVRVAAGLMNFRMMELVGVVHRRHPPLWWGYHGHGEVVVCRFGPSVGFVL